MAVPAEVATLMAPVPAPAGAVTINLLLAADITVATTPLNLTVLSAAETPKFAPVTVTDVPTTPEAGEIAVIAGITGISGFGTGLFFLQPDKVIRAVKIIKSE